MNSFPLITLLLTITFVTAKTLIPSKEDLKTYTVRKIDAKPVLSGKGNDEVWKRAHIASDFHYPWEKGTPPPTRFKALHNEEWLYLFFEVEDPSVFILEETNHKSEVAASSRAEIFFKRDDKMNPYYCLEIDPLGRVLDYEATFHRKFDITWSWPKEHLVVKTNKHNDGYTLEFAITKSSLKELGLLKNNVLQAGLYRADCVGRKNGETEFKWISWGRPDSPTPDFHIPSSFGIMRLED